jgi:hypothetical protein
LSENALFVADEGDLRKYRTETPNVIYDMGLGPREGWLYSHLKRIAGDSGVCWKGTKALAEIAGMSTGAVSEAKKALAERGLIRVAEGDRKKGEADEIRIVNIWRRNFRHFDNAEEPAEQPLQIMNAPFQTPSLSEHTPSNNETKKEPLELLQETPPDGGAKKPVVPTASSPPKSPKKKRVAALDDVEAERLFAELCDLDPNGGALRDLARLLAEENATGRVAITRVWREIGDRYAKARAAPQNAGISEEAWAYGFGEAVSRGKPNVGYVQSAARGYRPPRAAGGPPARASGGRARSIAVVGATEADYDEGEYRFNG